MVTMTTTTVDVIADTAVDVVTEHETLEAAHEAARAAVPAGWILLSFGVSDWPDEDLCEAVIVRG